MNPSAAQIVNRLPPAVKPLSCNPYPITGKIQPDEHDQGFFPAG
jgi:hypothetical protein